MTLLTYIVHTHEILLHSLKMASIYQTEAEKRKKGYADANDPNPPSASAVVAVPAALAQHATMG